MEQKKLYTSLVTIDQYSWCSVLEDVKANEAPAAKPLGIAMIRLVYLDHHLGMELVS